jgi:hypothetical protein
MRRHGLLACGLVMLMAALASGQSRPATTRASRPAARAEAPTTLPGNGLSQHPFLYVGEWDTRNPEETIFLVKGGKVVWTYSIPDKNEKGELNEFDDIHLLSNGNVLFARKTGAGEVNPEKQIVWNYDCPPGGECHSAQPIGLTKVFLCENGTPAKAMIIDKKSGQVEMEHELATKPPVDQKSVHGQFRHARITRAGTYLIPHLNMGKVVEYDNDWHEIWSVDSPSCWAAVRLANGNTLISGNQHGYVREVNPKSETVWEINKDDLPGCPLYTVQEVNRLANGNTVISNWAGSIRKEDWDKVVQVIEVTPEKRIVWALHQWKDPDLGPSSCIQLLDEEGEEENFDHLR